MYKTVLLTHKEIMLLLDIINHKMDGNSGDNLVNQTNNIHIVKRHLMGLIPTKNNEKLESLGN
jgi:hypothetical protein